MENRDELLRLLSSMCDGQLSDADQSRLEQFLVDEEARRLYLQYVDMHARLMTYPDVVGQNTMPGVDALAGVMGEAANRAVPAVRHRVVERRRGRSLQVLRYLAVAAATLAATILVQIATRQPRRPTEAVVPAAPLVYVATLSQAADVEWGAGTAEYKSGARILAGEMELRKGIARIGYDGGIELIVQGPARLVLENASSATLLTGKVVFKADDASAPFTLKTPASILVDIGTEYAVEVGADEEEVHVFSGEVRRLPKEPASQAQAELLLAGDARRYGGAGADGGEPARVEPEKFVRQLPVRSAAQADPLAGLLAYEGFDYADEGALRDETANGGSGFASAWSGGFARYVDEKKGDRIALNADASLTRADAPTASMGGSFEHVGFAKYFRRLAVPVRMDGDGVYYVSFLFRREGPPLDPLNDVSIQFRETEELAGDQRDATIDLRKRLNFGVDRTNELFTHLERIGRRMPLPLSYGETYLLVAKVVASVSYPDQVFLRVYGPQEPVDRDEPGSWSAIGPPVQSDLVFDWLEIHINSHTRQAIDEIRLGTTWASVAAPWAIDHSSNDK